MKKSEYVARVKYMLSRTVNKAFNQFSKIFTNQSGTIVEFKNFLITIPVKIHYQNMPTEEYADAVKRGDVHALLGGYIVGDEKNLQYYEVHLIVYVPQEPNEDLLREYEQLALAQRSRNNMSYIENILFTYMHEVMHILKKHYTKAISNSLSMVIKEFEEKHNVDIPKEIKHNMKNIACDFYINGYLLSVANKNSGWYAERSYILSMINNQSSTSEFTTVLYHPDFDPTQHDITEFDILEKLLEHAEVTRSCPQCSSSCSCDNNQTQSNQSGGEGNQGDQEDQGDQNSQGHQNDQNDDSKDNQSNNNQQSQSDTPSYYDIDIDYKGFKYKYRVYETPTSAGNVNSATDKSIAAEREARNNISQTLRGIGAASIMSDLGVPLEVETDWLDTLMRLATTEIKYIKDRQLITWRKLKNKYRHIAHLPTTIGYDNVVNVIISVDQSGSMSDDDIRKINYVILEMLNMVNKVHFIVHDWDIAHYTVFENTYADESVRQEIERVISTRYAAGGTSHTEVFKKINEIMEDESIEYIYISFSDNYSDIDNEYNNIIVMKDKIHPIWVKTGHGRTLSSSVPGIQIDMESGQIIAEKDEIAEAA